jgi:hypothetical protein
MVTAADCRRRLEGLERGPSAQETKIFFIDGGEDEALTASQWKAVRAWEKAHPWGRAHVIICEYV